MTDRPRMPAALRAWLQLERRVYGAVPATADAWQDALAAAGLEVVVNGRRGLASLWPALLARETPHLQVVEPAGEGRGRLLAESILSLPERLLFGRSLRLCLARLALLAGRALARRAATGGEALPEVEFAGARALGAASVAAFAARHVGDKLLNQLRKPFARSGYWFVAHAGGALPGTGAPLRFAADDAAIAGAAAWRLLPCPADRFYADPFPWVDAAGRRHLFFEDLSYRSGRGVIAHLDADAPQAAPQTVLERPYHLSYPFLFEHEGRVFMIPETSANRTIEVYEAVRFPLEWKPAGVLMDDVVATDTTLHRDGATWWLFTCLAEDEGTARDELFVFHAPGPFGPWTAHPMNPVKSDCRSARMGGNLYRDAAGRLLRPAQDCEREYGAALALCEVTELSPTRYAERVVATLHPPRGCSGLHTWNAAGGLRVVDVKTTRRR